MKRLLAIIPAVILVISLGITAYALTPATEETAPYGSSFVDENNDNICDNRAARISDGTCQRGEFFVDADQDGVCDNFNDAGNGCPRKNGGNGFGRGCRRFPNE